MSYEVFAQKWRPQYFRDVVGQAHVTATLQNQIRSKRLGHAYLFWGPRGTGKTTVARLFAKAVNCLNPQQETDLGPVITGEPCNECDACKEITQGSSFDVREMDAASNRGIDTIRDLRENVKLSPAAYKYKIYIIDEVHMLTTEGFNALLKTLEEPPSHVIFIMATTEHAEIPKTIISRCQDFDFRHLIPDQIISRLQLIVDTEEISADSEVLSLIARQSEGCLRDAENLLERLVTSTGKDLMLANVEETLGLGSSSLLYELTEAIVGRNLNSGLAALNQLSVQGMNLTQCLHHLITYFRDLRLLAIDNQLDELIQSPKSELSALKEKAEQIPVDRLTRIIKILMHANHEIKEYGYAQLHLESALIQINAIKEGIQLEEIVNKLVAIEQKIASTETQSESTPNSTFHGTQRNPTIEQMFKVDNPIPSSQETKTSSQTVPNPDTEIRTPDPIIDQSPQTTVRSLDELSDIWTEVKSRLPRILALGLFEKAVPTPDGEDRIKIACPQASFSLADEEAKQNITKIFIDVIGKPVQIELVKEDVVPKTKDTTETSEEEVKTTPLMRKRQAEEDEQIRRVLDQFDARILET